MDRDICLFYVLGDQLYKRLDCQGTSIQGGDNMKGWTKPKLIVLYRGRSEERVLLLCKDGGITPLFPSDVYNYNCTVAGAVEQCDACDSYSTT